MLGRAGSCWPAVLLLLAGCAAPQAISYHGRSFVPVLELSEEEREQRGGDAEVRETSDLDNDAQRLFAEGYELVGFSKFVSPLAPLLADVNAEATAEAKGATLALAEPPQPARFRQHYYLATYWRRADPADYILGAWYADLPASTLAAVGCLNNAVMVLDVLEGTPAARHDLRKGDTLWSANGRRITSAAVLDRQLLAYAGGELRLVVARDDGVHAISLALNPNRRGVGLPHPEHAGGAGFEVDAMKLPGDEDKAHFVAAIEPGSPACVADLQAGDRILRVNGEPMDSVEQLEPFASLQEPAQLTVRRGARDYDITLEPVDPAQIARAALPEAAFGFPWRRSKPSDWSALAGTLQAAQIMLSAAQQYTAAQVAIAQKENARRAELYRRTQAARAAEPVVWEGRGRVLYTRASNGQTVRISPETAAAMAANPGATVHMARGRAYLTNATGERIITQPVQASAVRLATPNPVMLQEDWARGMIDASVLTVDLSSYTTQALIRNARIRSGDPVYGELRMTERNISPNYWTR